MNNKEYITLYSTFAMLCYFQHNIAKTAYFSVYSLFLLITLSVIGAFLLKPLPLLQLPL